MTRQPLIAACALVALVCFIPAGRAAELVTLRNGFQMKCDHYAAAGNHVRLYLTAGEDNYIDLLPSEIATVAYVADPIATPPPDPPPADPPAAKASSVADPAPPAALTQADLGEMLAQAGQLHNLDVDLLASVVHAESGGNPRAVSRAGARGLMQLMPATAASLGVENSFQPRQNVSGGSAYLDGLLTRYGNNLALALAAYNAGPEAVDRYHGIPPYPETRVYVARVIHEFNRRVRAREAAQRLAAPGQPMPHKLQPAVAQK
jgi:hypothetical protein